MMRKRDIITLVILGLIFTLILAVILLTRDRESEIRKKTEFNELTLVDDETIFMSV